MPETIPDREESLRAFALEQAVAANPTATATVIARDAEVFLKFLNGEPRED
jgi:hypothetical protein